LVSDPLWDVDMTTFSLINGVAVALREEDR
jgi:hypothetical protein